MYNPGWPSTRKLQPTVGIKGEITHWHCSICSWTMVITDEFVGVLVPAPYTAKCFDQHSCFSHGIRLETAA
jgi:hypothetical protein